MNSKCANYLERRNKLHCNVFALRHRQNTRERRGACILIKNLEINQRDALMNSLLVVFLLRKVSRNLSNKLKTRRWANCHIKATRGIWAREQFQTGAWFFKETVVFKLSLKWIGGLQNSLIRDRIVCGIDNNAVRERLLQDNALSFDKATDWVNSLVIIEKKDRSLRLIMPRSQIFESSHRKGISQPDDSWRNLK